MRAIIHLRHCAYREAHRQRHCPDSRPLPDQLYTTGFGTAEIVGREDVEHAELDEDQDRDTGPGEQGLDGAQEERGGGGRGARRPTGIRAEVPGPESRALMERKRSAVPQGWANAISVFVKEARGALVTDVDGNTFIDFAGGIGAVNVGHADPRLVEAVREQVGNYVHTAFQAAPYEPFVELAEKLNALVPGDFEKKTIFANSGSEAVEHAVKKERAPPGRGAGMVENAVKMARAHTGREAVLAFENGLHGRTLLTMTLTSKAGPYKDGFGPFAPAGYRAAAAHPHRPPGGE